MITSQHTFNYTFTKVSKFDYHSKQGMLGEVNVLSASSSSPADQQMTITPCGDDECIQWHIDYCEPFHFYRYYDLGSMQVTIFGLDGSNCKVALKWEIEM